MVPGAYLMGLDELGWRLWLRRQPGGRSLVAETSGAELCPWSCPVSRFYLASWMKTSNTHYPVSR